MCMRANIAIKHAKDHLAMALCLPGAQQPLLSTVFVEQLSDSCSASYILSLLHDRLLFSTTAGKTSTATKVWGFFHANNEDKIMAFYPHFCESQISVLYMLLRLCQLWLLQPCQPLHVFHKYSEWRHFFLIHLCSIEKVLMQITYCASELEACTPS